MELRGTAYPSSGYTDEIRHHITVLDQEHPVCAGLGDGFDIEDELYLHPVFDDSFVPLREAGDFDKRLRWDLHRLEQVQLWLKDHPASNPART